MSRELRGKMLLTPIINSEITVEASLAKLQKQVMVALIANYRTIAHWDNMVDTVYWLEDKNKNSSGYERMFRR